MDSEVGDAKSSVSFQQHFDQEHGLTTQTGLSLSLGLSPCCGLEWAT